ncbi:hypothetical protein GCM10027053_27690 [Intrasporangium mesophilum]
MDQSPELDPAVEAQVRALLAQPPDPSPMPQDVSERIAAAIAHEARLRVDPGPLSTRGAMSGPTPATPGTPGMSGMSGATTPEAFGGTVTEFPVRNRRPRPLQLAAAVAAAAAVVAIGASALHLTQRPNGAAVVGDSITSTTRPRTPATPGETPSVLVTTGGEASGAPHIQLSTTAYDSGNLASQARGLLDHPGAPLQDLAAEAPHLGPIATPIGLQSCLSALGVSDPAMVSADLATFEGRPAAIVVVTRGGTTTAWAVERSCAEGQPGILKDATPVP